MGFFEQAEVLLENQKKAKQERHRTVRPEHLFLFGGILYLALIIVAPFMKKHPRIVTVEPGEIVSNTDYTGIILRDEQLETAPRSGYPVYYLQEGKRAAVGNRIYALTSTDVTPLLQSSLSGNNALDADNIHEIKNRLSSYRKSYDRDQFIQNYAAEDNIQSLLSSYASLSLLDNLDAEMKKQGIELTDVRFSYQDGKEVLHGVSLALAPHTLNAFVGQSGSGKTTLARLIAGYWDIDSGSLKIGGRESTDIPLAQLYDLVSFVAQDAYLFDDSIRENIRMGRPQASDEEVERAARAAGCEDFILRLAHGYDTRVGTGGSHVSGGERQRIAIARAVLKDAPIVVLDEATAYVDPENEAILQRAVARLIAGKTVIIIAHRLSTITDADKIFLIEAGMVAASGTHEELLAAGGRYAAMWRSQDLSEETDAAALTAQIDRLRAESAGQEEK